MAIYFIDYENKSDVSGFSQLKEGDKVFIFYSDKNDKMTFDQHIEIKGSAAEINCIKAYRPKDVKNALDFQLIFLFSRMAKENPDEVYYIVAGDKGYNSVKNMCKEYGINFKVIDAIKPTSKAKKTAVKDTVDNAEPESNPEMEENEVSTDDFKTVLADKLKGSGMELTEEEISGVIGVSNYYGNWLISKIKKVLGGDEKKASKVTRIVAKYQKKKKK